MRYDLKEVRNSKDAEEVVNVVLNSNDELGRRLSAGYPFKFDTVFGKVGNLRNAMDYIVTPNYPVKLLSKGKLTSSDINKIPKKKNNMINYYAAIAYLIGERLSQDEETMEMIKANDKVLSAYYLNEREVFGKKITVYIPKKELTVYLSILNKYADSIKNGTFQDDIMTIVESYKRDKESGIFEGSHISVDMKN